MQTNHLSESLNAGGVFVDAHIHEGRGGRPAILCAERVVSYGDLQASVNRFGNILKDRDIRMEERVAILLPDVPEFAFAFFGTMKAGAVAVPFNTLLGPDEYEYLLSDSRARLLVADAALLEPLLPILDRLNYLKHIVVWGGDVRDYPRLESLLEKASPVLEAAATCPDDVAFWLYSSGTTGFPKGTVHLHHDMIVASDGYARQTLGLDESDLSFSVAKLFFAYGLGNGLYFPLRVGGTSVLLPGKPLPDAVFGIIDRYRPTVFYSVPTSYAALLQTAEREGRTDLGRVRLCVSAGEPLPRPLFERWRERFGVEILDGIGSTEALHIFISNRPGEARGGSAGRLVPGYGARIVDEGGVELPPGEVGTLLIRGDSIASGYWNKHEETKRTILGEWCDTRDKFRVDEEGFYYYAGRSDDMMKVAGQWVSPTEIEAILQQHPAVLEGGVVGIPDEEGLTNLAAYTVLKEGIPPSPELELELALELQGFVRDNTAPHHHSCWIEFLEDLPKTATGKIQRFKLREMREGSQGGAPANEFPRSEARREESLVEYIQSQLAMVLGLDGPRSVDIQTDFFTLGMDSAGAVALANRLQTGLGCPLSAALLFKYATPHALAHYLADSLAHSPADHAAQTTPALEALPRQGHAPLSFPQREVWRMASQSEAHNSTYAVSFLLRIRGSLDTDILQKTLDELVRRHETLRTVFRPGDSRADGEPVQVVLPESGFPLSMEHAPAMEAERESALERWVSEVAKRPFVLSTGPLARASLLEMGDDDRALLITTHHIVIDVWSMGIFYRELGLVYNAFLEGKPSPLPELEIQYTDFAHWQRRAFSPEQSAKQWDARLEYWRQWLSQEPPPLELPTDRPRPPVETFLCHSHEFRLSPEAARQLAMATQQSESTLFMTMMAVFALVICRWSGQPEIVVGVPFSNRSHKPLESLIGVFAQSLLIRIDTRADTGSNPDFAEVLARVREANLSALANQDIPQRHFIGQLQPERDLRNRPPYGVMLNFMPENLAQSFELGSATVTPSELDNRIRPDLLLNFWEERNGAETALRGMWRYKTELFDAETIAGVARDFQTLLEGVIASPP